ncbi:hypothetical protein DERP_011588 [Dermatophagoides pteronyssinus]|uniref:Uncharacterized protein n=1 Tax=Dermatophagoides pteronyssinus TaxID=6956 RepID=A0ABQ8JWC2_DERPT|nr:hypothetical protein DERP_011588 [Dermatophagoides pteronyssinus]
MVQKYISGYQKKKVNIDNHHKFLLLVKIVDLLASINDARILLLSINSNPWQKINQDENSR